MANLQKAGLTTAAQVIEWCIQQLELPRAGHGKSAIGRRKHAKIYYFEIINFLKRQG